MIFNRIGLLLPLLLGSFKKGAAKSGFLFLPCSSRQGATARTGAGQRPGLPPAPRPTLPCCRSRPAPALHRVPLTLPSPHSSLRLEAVRRGIYFSVSAVGGRGSILNQDRSVEEESTCCSTWKDYGQPSPTPPGFF